MKIGIIGGGIVGLAIAKTLSNKGKVVTVFEKDEIGDHQSGNNSGVLHCGLHYKPGSLKAKLAVDGIRKMIAFCEKNQIDHEICGKVVVATSSEEVKRLNDLAERGHQNGLRGLEFLSNQELLKREPHTKAYKALLVPEEGIVDYKGVMRAMLNDVESSSGLVLQNTPVYEITQFKKNKTILHTKTGEYEFDIMINCAGLYTDKIFKAATTTNPELKIIPFRGEYLTLKDEFKHIVNHLIYPVPDPAFPFLGVHYTRMINGEREVGPNAVLALKREGYKRTDFNLKEASDALFFKGLHKFLLNNFMFSISELSSSLTLGGFVKKAKKLIPDVEGHMFETRKAGVRAQAMSNTGELLMDFEIKRFNNQVHLLNAPSPGATASLAIAEFVCDNYVL